MVFSMKENAEHLHFFPQDPEKIKERIEAIQRIFNDPLRNAGTIQHDVIHDRPSHRPSFEHIGFSMGGMLAESERTRRPKGEDFDAVSDKFRPSEIPIDIDSVYDYFRDVDVNKGHFRILFYDDPLRVGDIAVSGSLASKYPDALEVESWEIPSEPET